MMNYDNDQRIINCKELSENDTIYTKHIPGCNILLKDHQLVLLNKCILHENVGIDITDDEIVRRRYIKAKTNIGIIADKVGSGKSYTILALITSNESPLCDYKITKSFGNGHMIMETREDVIDKNVNVLVVPHTLIRQWSTSIKQFSNDLKYFIVNKTKGLDNLENEVDKNDILLVTGTFYNKVCGQFYLNNWRAKRLIFDEADSTNTPCASYMKAKFYWFITASYKNLLFPNHRVFYDRRNISASYIISDGVRNNTFIKNMFINLTKSMDRVDNNILDKIILKNADEFVDKSFNLADPKTHIIMCRNPIEVNILSGVVNSEIINCLNAGDFQRALEYVNPNNVTSEHNIIDQALTELNTKLNNYIIQLEATRHMTYGNEEQRNNIIARYDKHICETREKIELMKKRIHDNQLCIICYNDIKNKTIAKCCQNCFCLQCITTWLTQSRQCPLCKKTVLINEDFFIVNDTVKEPTVCIQDVMYKVPSNDEITMRFSKFQNLERLINCRKVTSKFLIFSDFEQSFYRMYDHLEKTNIRYSHVKGNGVNSTIQKYKNNELDALLVNSKNYGSGLNLENTTDVVLFHKFEREIEKQVIGRAQRPGRKLPLNIWYFLNENEMQNINI